MGEAPNARRARTQARKQARKRGRKGEQAPLCFFVAAIPLRTSSIYFGHSSKHSLIRFQERGEINNNRALASPCPSCHPLSRRRRELGTKGVREKEEKNATSRN